MLNDSIISESALRSPLAEGSTIKPKEKGRKKMLVAPLMLTSLVDAFSILVVYLLMSFASNGEILYINKDTELPTAINTEVLERNTIIKIEEGKLFVENEEVAQKGLVAKLLEVRKRWAKDNNEQTAQESEPAVTIQADRRVKYELLNSVVLASSHAGFSDINFAVLQK